MSSYTQVMILCSSLERLDDNDLEARLNDYWNDASQSSCDVAFTRIQDWAGGNGAWGSYVLAGNFKLLIADTFLSYVAQLPWKDPKAVQILLHEDWWGQQGFEVWLLWTDDDGCIPRLAVDKNGNAFVKYRIRA